MTESIVGFHNNIILQLAKIMQRKPFQIGVLEFAEAPLTFRLPLNTPFFLTVVLCSGTKLGKNASELLKMISGDRCRSNDILEEQKTFKVNLGTKIHRRYSCHVDIGSLFKNELDPQYYLLLMKML